MHDTAWKLVADYVEESVPVWDISVAKSQQGMDLQKGVPTKNDM